MLHWYEYMYGTYMYRPTARMVCTRIRIRPVRRILEERGVGVVVVVGEGGGSPCDKPNTCREVPLAGRLA